MSLTHEDIKYWLDLYYKEEKDSDFPDLEKNLSVKLGTFRTLTKDDLKQVIRWKFQGKLKGRGERFVKMIENQDEETIKERVNKALYKNIDDYLALHILTSIKGVGPAVASVILTFFNPHLFCVLDRHVWNELFNENKEEFSTDDYIKLLKEIRQMANKYDMFCRDVEKALFMKNKESVRTA